MRYKMLNVIVCAVLLLAGAHPLDADAAQTSGDVRIGAIFPANQLDPQLAQNSTEAVLVDQLFLGLTGLDAKGNVVPALAQSWDISDDGLTYVFTLRSGVQWVDANRRLVREVIANDVGFSLERAIQFGSFEGVIEGAEVLDDFTIMIFLQRVIPDFLTVLAVSPAAKVVPTDLVLEIGEGAWATPGTIWSNGPYLLADQSRTTVVLEPNPFWDGERTGQVNAVRIEYIPDPQERLRRYVNDELDLIELEPEFRDILLQDPGFAQRVHNEGGVPLDLFSGTIFARQISFGHSYLVKEYLLPVYSSYFGLSGMRFWQFNNQIPVVQISENTRVLNDETLGALLSIDDQGTLTFARQTAQLELIQIGDILVGASTLDVGTDAAPFGFLLRVVNLSLISGQFVVETTPAYLDEAIVRGSLTQEIVIDLGDIYDIPPVSSVPRSGGIVPIAYAPPYAGLEVKIDNVLYDADGDTDVTKDDQVRVLGKVNVESGPGLHLSLDIQNNRLQKLRFTNSLQQTAELKVYSNVNLATLKKEVVVQRYIFTPQTVFIGWVPVVITPELSVVIGIDGRISVKVSTGIEQSSIITVGAGYDSNGWNPILEMSNFHVGPVETLLEQGASARAYAGPELAVTIYGVAGPYGRVQGYLKLEADPAIVAAPWWELTGGIEGQVGVKAQIFSVVDLRYSHAFNIHGPQILAQAGVIIPTATYMPTPQVNNPNIVSCGSNLWPPGCWDWWVWLIVIGLILIALRRMFKKEE